MRKNIILIFLFLLTLQAIQVILVSRFIIEHRTAINRVTLTVEGREISRSTRILINQIRDNVIIVAGMNVPAKGLKKLNDPWENFLKRSTAMIDLSHKIIDDSALLGNVEESIYLTGLKKIQSTPDCTF